MNPSPFGVESTPRDPKLEYERRLAEARAGALRLARKDDAIGNARLFAFLLAAVLAGLAWYGTLPAAWSVAGFVGFAALVVAHGRVIAERRRADGLVTLHERNLARIDDRWAGSGVPGTRFLDENHPYAADLDLFGVGSLFERLCEAKTAEGESTLASWLLAPAPIGEIAARREAVIELTPRLDLRENLLLRGAEVRSGVAPDGLGTWGATPQRRSSGATRWMIGAVSVLTLGSLVGWFAALLPLRYFLGLLAAEVAIAATFARRTDRALAGVEDRAVELATLAGLLALIEREPFQAARLRELKAELGAEGVTASGRIGRLSRLVRWLEARHNVYFALFGSLVLWKTQFGLAIEDWRSREGASIARWLELVGQFEALESLAGYAFENPSDPFAEVVPDGPLLQGEALGHPLLPASTNVRNDLALGGDLRVLAVSGSNMSGKSTWLRTVGINAVLAQMGAPVRARWMRISPLAIGGTLRVHDSLQSGRSRFYAEILRLKQLVDTTSSPPPLLFLIDEILHGTNSHDRLQGAEAIVRGLVDRGAIGLFTTHDLTLAGIADRLPGRAVNVHFADQMDDSGRLAFDYRMRPGVVTQSNALALMRAVGLEV